MFTLLTNGFIVRELDIPYLVYLTDYLHNHVLSFPFTVSQHLIY